MKTWTRKEFLKSSLIGGGAAVIASQTRLFGQVAPAAGSANGDIRIAVVGINAQGAGHIKTYYPGKMAGTRLVALCDVDSAVLDKRVAETEKDAGVKVTAYRDYRKLLEDKNIDAVVLASPNHQHSLQTIWALQAGKDVYCEKPLSHNVWEGRQAVEASKKYTKNIVQAGTQNRSSEDIKAAIEYIKSGKIGKIQWARALCYKERPSIGKTTGPQPVPATIDYNLWTGPADLIEPRRNSPKNGTVHYDWHWFWNCGGGDITNQGIHQMDVARWMLGEAGLAPSVMSFGGRFGYLDDAETPNTLISVLGYEKAPLIFEVRGLPKSSTEVAVAGKRQMDRYRAAQVGVVVQCEYGYIHVTEGGNAVAYDTNNNKIQTFAEGGNGAHRANFVKAVKSRKVINGLVEECHYSSALCHLANVSYLVGAEKSNAELADAVKSNAPTHEAFARMLEHLKANEVNVETAKTVVGPLLKIDRKTEMFTGSEATIVKAANNSPLRKREGRGEFKIPTLQNGAVAAS
jgi:predicted dehydrogenase